MLGCRDQGPRQRRVGKGHPQGVVGQPRQQVPGLGPWALAICACLGPSSSLPGQSAPVVAQSARGSVPGWWASCGRVMSAGIGGATVGTWALRCAAGTVAASAFVMAICPLCCEPHPSRLSTSASPVVPTHASSVESPRRGPANSVGGASVLPGVRASGLLSALRDPGGAWPAVPAVACVLSVSLTPAGPAVAAWSRAPARVWGSVGPCDCRTVHWGLRCGAPAGASVLGVVACTKVGAKVGPEVRELTGGKNAVGLADKPRSGWGSGWACVGVSR